MSIASRITAIEGHIENAYDKISDLGVDLTDVDKNIDNISEMLEEVYEGYPKVTAEGTDLTLNSTKKGKMVLGLKGNTSQESTTGKNVLNLTDVASAIKNGVTYSVENQTYNLSGTNQKTDEVWTLPPQQTNLPTFEVGESYTFKITGTLPNNIYVQLNYKDSSNVNHSLWSQISDTNEHTVTIPNDYAETTLLFIGIRTTATNVTGSFKIQIEKGSSATDWEPYTGGQASPNPDYPQDIHVVTGENSVKVQSQNLFNPNNIIEQIGCTINNDEITITDNSGWGQSYIICGEKLYAGTYTCSVYGNSDTVHCYARGYKNGSIYEQKLSNFYSYNSYYRASDKGIYSQLSDKLTFTLPSDCDYYYVCIALGRNGTETIKIKVEKGEIENPTYTPHAEQNYPVNLGSIELCKIGDYQDYLYRENGNWYKHGAVGKVVLDGSEHWIKRSDVNYTNIETFRDDDYRAGQVITNSQGYSNYFKIITSQQETEGIRFLNADSYGYQVQIKKTTASTAEELKTYFSTHNTEVFYPLATPVITPITDTTLVAQLEAIYKAQSYDNQTNISQTNEDLPFVINASALKASE